MTTNISTHTLANGLKLVHVPQPQRVGWCGLVVNSGSRDDAPNLFGQAHFVEHTIFKGTTHRRACHIINRMETVGGELNAYTTKEGTVLYSVFPEPYFNRAIDLLADLVMYSVFPDTEIQREKEVVLEEVYSYRDAPSEAVFDDFEDLIFGADTAMGHNILGTEAHIQAISSAHCRQYLKQQYVPENMAFFYLGPTPAHRVFRKAEKCFGAMHHRLCRTPRTTPPILAPQRRVVNIGSHQSHTIVGARIPNMYHESRFALALLNNLLAGPGMNSLLNVQMRERRGLVYTVESSIAAFTDCGLMEIYFGCEQSKVEKSLHIIGNTIDRLAQSPLSAAQLHAAKKQYCGQLLVASQNVEAMALGAGKTFLYWNRVPDIDHTVEHIQAVSAEQIRQAAEMLHPSKATILSFQ